MMEPCCKKRRVVEDCAQDTIDSDVVSDNASLVESFGPSANDSSRHGNVAYSGLPQRVDSEDSVASVTSGGDTVVEQIEICGDAVVGQGTRAGKLTAIQGRRSNRPLAGPISPADASCSSDCPCLTDAARKDQAGSADAVVPSDAAKDHAGSADAVVPSDAACREHSAVFAGEAPCREGASSGADKAAEARCREDPDAVVSIHSDRSSCNDVDETSEGTVSEDRIRSEIPLEQQLAGILRERGLDVADDTIVRAMCRFLRDPVEEEIRPKVFDTFDMNGVADKIRHCSNIIVMVGAGLSTAAGIPDFRTPGTGLYDNLSKYDLPEPESLFTLTYFRSNPAPFYDFCQQLWPDTDNYRPTFAHYFVTLLEKKGKLLRCYSQNIDSLEELAGLSGDKLVAAHGNFSSCAGIDSHKEVPVQEVKEAVMAQKWEELVQRQGELIKPNIVFFGEEMPTRFYTLAEEDFPKCDLLVVLGTSLVVAPFNHLISLAEVDCPRVLVNREPAGTDPITLPNAFRFNDVERNYRDVFLQGDLNEQVRELCTKLDWLHEVEELERLK